MLGDLELFTYIKYFYNTIYSSLSIKKNMFMHKNVAPAMVVHSLKDYASEDKY